MSTLWLFVLAGTAVACSAAQTPEACFAPRVAELNARAAAELAVACQASGSIDDCPAAPAIDARYDQAIETEKQRCLHGAP